MSIYHCSIKIISRAGGRSAVASAAYRSGEKLYNEETGLMHDFSRKGGVVYTEILLPENAPDRFRDRQTLWNEVQKVEKRSDAQFAREVEVAFPVEMNREEQVRCLHSYVSKNFVSKGMIADIAIHDKGDGNPHAHILLTVRAFDEQKRWSKKQKTVFANARDKEGRPVYDPDLPSYDPKDKEGTAKYRIPVLDKDGNQKTRTRKGKGTEYLWERITISANDWNDHARAEEWRASWAEECNRFLDPDKQIDHRSYERQGKEMEPTIHEGVAARQMETKGRIAERCDINREIRERNSIRREIRRLAREITETVTEIARGIYERIKKLGRDPGHPYEAGGDGLPYGRDSGGKGDHRDRESEIERTAARIDAAKRSARIAESKITETDQRIAEIQAEIKRKGEERNARIRKLMERRSASHRDGEDAGPDRSPSWRERPVEAGSLTWTADDIRTFLAGLDSKERAAEKVREDREVYGLLYFIITAVIYGILFIVISIPVRKYMRFFLKKQADEFTLFLLMFCIAIPVFFVSEIKTVMSLNLTIVMLILFSGCMTVRGILLMEDKKIRNGILGTAGALTGGFVVMILVARYAGIGGVIGMLIASVIIPATND